MGTGELKERTALAPQSMASMVIAPQVPRRALAEPALLVLETVVIGFNQVNGEEDGVA